MEDRESPRRLALKGGAKHSRGTNIPRANRCFASGSSVDIEDISAIKEACGNEWDFETDEFIAKNWGWIHSIDSMTSVDGPGFERWCFFKGSRSDARSVATPIPFRKTSARR